MQTPHNAKSFFEPTIFRTKKDGDLAITLISINQECLGKPLIWKLGKEVIKFDCVYMQRIPVEEL